MAKLEYGSLYRVRAVPGQYAIKTTPNEGTQLVEVMLEITDGPCKGRRAPWTGWLNSKENRQKAAAELKALGWTAQRWSDPSGITRNEVQAKLMSDERGGNVFPRFAFLAPLRVISRDNESTKADMDRLDGLMHELEDDDDAAEPPMSRASSAATFP